MADVPMYYLSQGQFDQALYWVFTHYIGYGLIWVLIGVAIFGTVHNKSRSAAISGMVFSMFLAIVGYHLPVEIQAYFTVISGILLFAVIYKVAR